jgi:hypothetical protein
MWGVESRLRLGARAGWQKREGKQRGLLGEDVAADAAWHTCIL